MLHSGPWGALCSGAHHSFLSDTHARKYQSVKVQSMTCEIHFTGLTIVAVLTVVAGVTDKAAVAKVACLKDVVWLTPLTV